MGSVTAVAAGRVRIEVLGRVRVWRGDQELRVGPPRQQAVLSVLALRANHAVSRDEIVDAVWGDRPPASAVNGVHLYIGALRQILEPERRRGDTRRLLAGIRSGYLLRLEPGQLDLDLLRERLQTAQQRSAAGELAGAVDAFDAALGLWHGTPLAGISSPFADAERLRLGELRLAAIEDRAEAMLGLGRHAELVAELSALAAEHPLRERLRGLLMAALSRSGRQADALALFADTRRLLVGELGIEPGPQLQRLHHQILNNQEIDLGVPVHRPVSHGARPPVRPVVPRQLPPAVRHFAGRADELDALTRLATEAGEAAVITAIHGTAGIGKTALAVYWAHQVADRFPDGQLFVNLRGFDPTGEAMAPREAIRGFLDAFEVPAERIPAGLQAQVGLYRSLLAGKRVLVVLDNARDVEQVGPLLPGAPGCLTVVTSRNTLTGLVAAQGAQPLMLDLLTTDEARQLLMLRLGAARVAGDSTAVDEIIGRSARLPLALALVAARATVSPKLPLTALASELRQASSRLTAFDTGDPTSDVRAVFSWSYRMLSDGAARLFRLFGLHPGPDLGDRAAASLAAMDLADVRPLLAELLSAHLITEHPPGRYGLHDLLRAYASELAEVVDPDTQATRHRMLDHYLHTADAAAHLLNPSRDPISLDPPRPGVAVEELDGSGAARAWFTAEYRTLLGLVDLAAARGFDVPAWQLARSLMDFADRRGHWEEWVAVLGVALAAARRAEDRIGQAFAHRGLALTHGRLGNPAESAAHYERAAGIYEEQGVTVGLAHSRRGLGWLFVQEHRYQDSLVHFERALDLYATAGHGVGQARCLNAIGWCHAQLGDFQQAMIYCQRALAQHQAAGDRVGEATTWDSLGYAHANLGAHTEAVRCYRRALELFRSQGNRYHEADTLIHLGDTYQATGEPGAARDAWRRALAILDELGHPDAAQVRTKLRALAS